MINSRGWEMEHHAGDGAGMGECALALWIFRFLILPENREHKKERERTKDCRTVFHALFPALLNLSCVKGFKLKKINSTK